MKNLNLVEKLNTESGKSMGATALGGFLGAVAFLTAKELEKGVVKLIGIVEEKVHDRKKVEVNPAVEVTEE